MAQWLGYFRTTLDAATTVGFHLEEATPGSDKWTARSEAVTLNAQGQPQVTVNVGEISGKVLRIVADITTEAK